MTTPPGADERESGFTHRVGVTCVRRLHIDRQLALFRQRDGVIDRVAIRADQQHHHTSRRSNLLEAFIHLLFSQAVGSQQRGSQQRDNQRHNRFDATS